MTSRLYDQFVGRNVELADLQNVISSARSGRGQLVLIGGEPGIGKSRLAQRACEMASADGMHVVRGSASERAGAPPYWIWSQPLSRLAQRFDAATPEGSGAYPEPLSLLVGSANRAVATDASAVSVSSRYVLFEQVLRLLEQHTAQEPVVIFLDDLQWADDSSLALLEFIAFDITGLPLLVIGTYRNVDLQAGHPLLDLLGIVGGKSGVTNLVLRGLGESEVEILVGGIAEKSIGQALAGDLLTRTGGNPLFLKLLALAGDSGSGDVPQSVVDVIDRRVSSLPPVARETLRVAAAIGDHFRPVTVSAVLAGLDQDTVMNSFDEAVSAHILISGVAPDMLSFSHGLVRESILSSIPPMESAVLHGKLADHLESGLEAGDRSTLSMLAFHSRVAAAVSGSGRAIKYGLQAAEQALNARAYSEALELSQQVIELIGEDETAPVSSDMADALLLRGQSRILSGSPGSRDLQTALRLALANSDVSRLTKAIVAYPTRSPGIPLELMDRVLAVIPGNSAAHARALGLFGLAAALSGKETDSHLLFAEAQESARDLEDISVLAQVTTMAAWMEFGASRYEQAAVSFSATIDFLRSSGDLPSLHHALQFRNASVKQSGQHVPLEWVNEVVANADNLRNPAAIAEANATAGYEYISNANWASVSTSSHTARDSRSQGRVGLGNLCLAEFEQGLDSATERLAEYLESLPEFEADSDYLDAMAVIEYGAVVPIVRAGGPLKLLGMAERLHRATVDLKRNAPQIRNEWLYGMVGLGQIAWLKRDVELAREIYPELAEYSNRRVGPPAMISTHEVLGMAAHLLGQQEDAQSHFELARKMYYRAAPTGGRNLPWLCVVQAETLAESGSIHRKRALEVVEEGLNVAKRCGMVTAENRLLSIRDELAGNSKTRRYPSNLTVREVEVLRELARGRSNREIAEILIISQNTVIRHVSNIFGKTGCANRAEAAAFAQRKSLLS